MGTAAILKYQKFAISRKWFDWLPWIWKGDAHCPM